ncbi:MAG: sensor histidine kinase [Chitinophagaceae bacterium]
MTFSALRSQMNPHFIFNALNTIQSYVYANDKRSASNYLGKFSELIRKILDNSSKQKITLEEEIHVLQLYIDIEKARFGDAFYAVIETDPYLDTEDIFVPPMLIQPYAENSIKHGLLHLAGEKRLVIRINKSTDQQYIEIVIDDNGIGREKSIEINKKRTDHHSFANEANEKRIDLINKLHEKKTKLEIIDKKNAGGMATGTTVIISFPVMSVSTLHQLSQL